MSKHPQDARATHMSSGCVSERMTLNMPCNAIQVLMWVACRMQEALSVPLLYRSARPSRPVLQIRSNCVMPAACSSLSHTQQTVVLVVSILRATWHDTAGAACINLV